MQRRDFLTSLLKLNIFLNSELRASQPGQENGPPPFKLWGATSTARKFCSCTWEGSAQDRLTCQQPRNDCGLCAYYLTFPKFQCMTDPVQNIKSTIIPAFTRFLNQKVKTGKTGDFQLCHLVWGQKWRVSRCAVLRTLALRGHGVSALAEVALQLTLRRVAGD